MPGQNGKGIAMVTSNNAADDTGNNGTGMKRESGQATLSAIRDLSIAASDAVGRIAPPPKAGWFPLIAFLLVVYIASSVVAIHSHQSPPWVQVFIAPLLPVLIAGSAFWRWQVWKRRSQDSRFREKVREDALKSLTYETANAMNAMYANLTAFRRLNPQPSTAPHLEQIDLALERIDAALEKAVIMLQPTQQEEAAQEQEESQAA